MSDPAPTADFMPANAGLSANAGGWILCRQYHPAGDTQKNAAIYRGPARLVDAAAAAILAEIPAARLQVSAAAGEAVATITATWSTASGATDTNKECAEPSYSVSPLSFSVSLSAHPVFAGLSGTLAAIDAAIRRGAWSEAEAIADAAAGQFERPQRYLGLRAAGVDSYDAVGYQLAVTRYWARRDDLPESIGTEYGNVNQVFAWSAIRTAGKAIPDGFPEPKITRFNGAVNTAVSASWRLDGINPRQQKGGEVACTWTFTGLERWSETLYLGGDWDPRYDAPDDPQEEE